jgi:hypothetical protein
MAQHGVLSVINVEILTIGNSGKDANCCIKKIPLLFFCASVIVWPNLPLNFDDLQSFLH